MSTAMIVNLGCRRELFVDDLLLEELKGTTVKLHHPQPREKVLVFDKPWEGAHSGYASTFKYQNTYYMYYRGWPYKDLKRPALHERGPQVTCLALSSDGIHWIRPDLALHEVNGTYENNVILAGNDNVCHNFTAFVDDRPGVPASERFKALGGTPFYTKGWDGIYAFASEDGIRWRKLKDGPVIGKAECPENTDESSNPVFWSEHEQCYVMYTRTRRGPADMPGGIKQRWVGRSTSKDFLHWSTVVPMEYQPAYSPEEMYASRLEEVDIHVHGGGREQLYTTSTHPYFRAPHIYIATPIRYVWGSKALTDEEIAAVNLPIGWYSASVSDGILMTSRGGTSYDQLFREAFFTPGPEDKTNWSSKNCGSSTGIVPTSDFEISLYYQMHVAVLNNPCTSHLLRCTLRTDGLVSVAAPYEGGELVTRPFIHTGKRLELNVSTSAAGSVRAELQDQGGRPIRGFGLDDCDAVVGNHIARTVAWKRNSDVSASAGRPVRLRFVMRDADLFSIRFAD